MRIVFSLMIAVFALACSPAKHDGYTLKGNIQGIEEGKIVLSYYDRANYKLVSVDSASIKNGEFEMLGKVDYPQQLSAKLSPGDATFTFWIENSEISIIGNMNKTSTNEWGQKTLPITFNGGKIQAESEAYNSLLKPIKKELKPFGDAYHAANMTYIKGIKSKLSDEELLPLKDAAWAAKDVLSSFYERMNEVNQNYLNKYPNSFVTATILQGSMASMKAHEAKAKYELFSDVIKNSRLGKQINTEIQKSLSGSAGSRAPSFSKKDINNKDISLEQFRGKYVLLDFWASWCRPCRAGNPHLIKLYNKYNKKGIEFIGIASDDNNIPAWNKAVKKDQIGIWHHILSGIKKQGNNIGVMYAIHTLPTKILINPQGMIIGRYSADGEDNEAMDKKFEEIFGK